MPRGTITGTRVLNRPFIVATRSSGMRKTGGGRMRKKKGNYKTEKLRDRILPSKQVKFIKLGGTLTYGMNSNDAIADDGKTYMKLDLTAISLGPQINQRIGTTLMIKGISFRLVIANNGSKNRCFRTILISPRSHLSGDVDATLSKLFTDYSGTAVAYDKLSGSIIKQVNRSKFRVFYDKNFKVGPESSTYGNLDKKVYKRLHIPVEYKQILDTAEAEINQLYLICMINEYDNTVVDVSNTATMTATVYYRDGHDAHVAYTNEVA